MKISSILSIVALGSVGANAFCLRLFGDTDFKGDTKALKANDNRYNYCLSADPEFVAKSYISGGENADILIYDNPSCSGDPIVREGLGNRNTNSGELHVRAYRVYGKVHTPDGTNCDA